MYQLRLLALLIMSLVLSACGGGSSNGSGSGTLSVSLTDSPVVGADKVVIYFTSVQVHEADGSTTDVNVIDPVTKTAGRSVDLLQLQGTKSLVLFDKELPAGNYDWMRLQVDFDPGKTYIQIGGKQYALNCTSCQNNGYKLNRSFKVNDAAVMAYSVDFDLTKSITLANGIYHLRPTLRVVETAASGNLSGSVDSTLISSLGGETGCAVYVYDGSNVLANDIYLPEGSALPFEHHNPVATAMMDATTHQYTVGYLAAGDYTAALTCDAENDNASTQDPGVTFHGTANITIQSGQTTTHDFTL